MGKTGRKNKTYSTEFKVDAIMDMREHHMGYRETARKYSIKHVYGNKKSTACAVHKCTILTKQRSAAYAQKFSHRTNCRQFCVCCHTSYPCPARTNTIVSRVTLPLAVSAFFRSYSRKKPTAVPNSVRFFLHRRRFSAFAADFAPQL